jgi:hypothetical protein
VAIELSCSCGKKLKVNEEFAGRTGVCPGCGQAIAIPAAAASPPPLPVAVTDRASMPPPLPQSAPPPLPRGSDGVPDTSTIRSRPPPEESEDAELRNHGGGEIPDNMDFFVDPPAEIGHVLSAYSTLTKEKEPWSIGGRLVLAMACAMIGILIGLLIIFLARPEGLIWLLLWPVGLGLLGGLIGFFCTTFTHTCTYVGRDGVARFMCRGDRSRLAVQEVFLFRDAVELRISQVRHYTNGVYQQTAYTYTWTDVAKHKRHVISGSHRSEKGNPPHKDFYHFAMRSELAWTVFLLNQSEAQLTMGGKITFRLKGDDVIRIGPNYLKLDIKGQVEELETRDIGDARIDQGTFMIEAADAKKGWFSSSGVYKFPYHDLGNAQLFLFLMDKLLGIQVR